MKTVLLSAAAIGVGGFIGALFRYAIGNAVQRDTALAAFPYGTLVVNMCGCLLIGLAVGIMETRQVASLEMRLFVLTGLLGGFTTYSTFAFETFALLRDADYVRAVANVAVHVVLGLLLVWVGYSLASR